METMPNPTESQIQIAIVDWFSWAWSQYARLLVHYPIGERRIKKHVWSKKAKKLIWICPDGQKLQRMGAKKDFPDLTLFVARGGYHGMVMEIKKLGEKPRQGQLEYLRALEDQEYYACWRDSFESAQSSINWYMRLKEDIYSDG